MPYWEPGYAEPGYVEGDSVAAACFGRRLVLTADDGTQTTLHPPGVACAPYPWLSKVGNLLLAARAGHLEGVGVGESANMTFEVSNEGKQASELLGYCVRARAQYYDAAGDLYFDGLVQQISPGHPFVLTVEAGGGTLLDSELLPLRTSRMLGDYSEDFALQHILGDWSDTQFPLKRLSDVRFFAADHPMTITKAFTAKQEAHGWEARLETDDAGHTWTTVVFAAPVPPDTEVSACGTGALDERTGALIEWPADFMRYAARLCGRTDDFSDFRAECAANDLRGAVRLWERKSYKATIDGIAQSFGSIVWHGGARLYPSADTADTILDLHRSEVTNLRATANLSDTADVLRLAYDRSDASDRALQYIELSASPQRYGGLAKEVEYPHLRLPANAEAIGAPVLQRLAGQKYDVTFDSDNTDIRPGMWVRPVAHPEWMVSDTDPIIMVLQVELDEDSHSVGVRGETIVGTSRITVTAHSVALPDTIEASVNISVRDGVATLEFIDAAGKPVAGAQVSMDGAAPKTTDAQGRVRFPVSVVPGKPVNHEFAFQKPGFDPFVFFEPI